MLSCHIQSIITRHVAQSGVCTVLKQAGKALGMASHRSKMEPTETLLYAEIKCSTHTAINYLLTVDCTRVNTFLQQPMKAAYTSILRSLLENATIKSHLVSSGIRTLCNGVCPLLSVAFNLAPFLRRNWRVVKQPTEAASCIGSSPFISPKVTISQA